MTDDTHRPSESTLSTGLRRAREAQNLTLDLAAQTLGLTSERLATWEAGPAAPGALQLRRLALLYRSSEAALLGLNRDTLNDGSGVTDPAREALLDTASRAGPAPLLAAQQWLSFLDELAELLGETAEIPQPVSQPRMAGDLLNRLWTHGVTAVHWSLPLGSPGELSYRHPQLGTCLLLSGDDENYGAAECLTARYPAPLLARLQVLIEEEALSPQAAASMLGVDLIEVLAWLRKEPLPGFS